MAASLSHLGRGALRVAKNYTKGYTDTQSKVRDATSNDPWGPSGTQMNEVAQLTYNQNDFVEVMEMMDKRLNDKGKNWRHVFKALTLLDYCLHAGSENVVIYFKDNIYIVKTLKEFVYVDESGKDVGANVRQKAKDITNLLQDEERLRAERRHRGAMRDRMLGNIEQSGLKGEGDYGEPRSSSEHRQEPPRYLLDCYMANFRNPPPRSRNEDDDLQRAIAASMSSSEDEARRRNRLHQEEDELARALRLSQEEDERRKREQEAATTNALFDDNLNLTSNNQYSQQPMQTGYPLVDVGYGQMQPQYTSYNPFQAQMLQQQQQEEYMRQQMMLQEQQRQQEEYQRQQEEYMRQQFLQQQSLLSQPTGYGSNNPFAPAGQTQHSQQQIQPQQTSFLPVPVISSPQPPPQQPKPVDPQPTARPAFQPPKDDGQHSQLASLLARGREDGMDTFGNVGNLRIPVGSSFAQSNRLAVQQTGAQGLGGNNPFGQAQQKQSDQPFFSV
ncbi:hypothetical protein BCR39DRAFT_510486 [Naematelia encephala]|uniref:ENTH domain-containing protein n=1 Tax=Naematelia encephala TaxID=71784 RepID=A0A1Y2BL82_9TREE|nr:hypothetical protein BCR39DRAFT_510486 [Naematelia encephala]